MKDSSSHIRKVITSCTLVAALIFAPLVVQSCDVLSSSYIETAPPPAESSSGSPDWFTAYFTDAAVAPHPVYRGGPDQHLSEAIRQARVSVDMAMHYLSLWSIRDALIDAHRRGVAVRVVTESENLDAGEMHALVEAGIAVIGDRRDGRMHNKFTVIDRQEVWTGSMNMSINGAYHHDNNLMRLRSVHLAEDYTAEFEEMFMHDRFGPGSPRNTPHTILLVDNTLIEVYFSPEDGAADRLVDLVRGAEESIYFMAYSFTNGELARAMVERARTGVSVAGVFDSEQYRSNAGSEYGLLHAAGLDVRLDGNADKMHHKVIIIDERTVITGSYNFSRNAETVNDENLLVIHSPWIAALYMDEFNRIMAEAQ